MTVPPRFRSLLRFLRAQLGSLPVITAIVLPLAVGGHTAGVPGVAWALVPALFCGFIPHMLNQRFKISGHDDTDRGKPAALLVGAALSHSSGIAILVAGAAPPPVLACACALFAVLAVLAVARMVALAITRGPRWRGRHRHANLSVHAAAAAGAASVCLIAFGWVAGAAGYLLAACVAVSRVWSADGRAEHTPVEAVWGALIGAVAAGLTYGWMA